MKLNPSHDSTRVDGRAAITRRRGRASLGRMLGIVLAAKSGRAWGCLVATGMTFAACSSDEFDPPNGGKSDAGADATADGDGSVIVVCSEDSDCDDGDACDGKETCKPDHTCTAGPKPCGPASDPLHCEIQCTDAAGTAECGNEVALDMDGDGHGEPLCLAAPGDDCNDGDPDAYPGATETCDGEDNDCDNLIDLEDGLPLGGAPFVIASPLGVDAVRPQAAWLTPAKRLGVVWQRNGVESRLTVLDDAGTPIESDIELATGQFDQMQPVITSDDTHFAVAWVGEIVGERRIFFRLFDADGVPASAPQNLAGPVESDAAPSVHRNGSGFVVAWRQHDATGPFVHVYAERLGADGAPLDTPKSLTSFPEVYAPSVASLDSSIAALTILTGAGKLNSKVYFLPLDDQLSPVQNAPLTDAVSPPKENRETALAPLGTNYFAAWTSVGETTGSLHVGNLTPAGSLDCGPESSTEFAADAQLGGADSLDATGLLAIYDNASKTAGRVKLARFSATTCTALPSIDVVGTDVVPANGLTAFGARSDVAVGDEIAVVWDEVQGGNGRIFGRIFGKKFCD